MMMQNPDENLFQDMLADYAAPVEEDGFSDSVLKTIEASTKREEHIRRISIYGACFVGGVIAASQFPALVSMAARIKIAAPTVPEAGALPLSTWSFAAIVLLGFVLWAALDRKVSEIF